LSIIVAASRLGKNIIRFKRLAAFLTQIIFCMKKLWVMLLLFAFASAKAQINKVSLQASGLTCSMCSKAVKNALESVSFVDKVQVDIKNQQYNLSFKEGSAVDFDALSKAVRDAGFSVASLKASASVHRLKIEKDEHVKIGGENVHFLNAAGQTLDGLVNFSIVDKGFVSAKEFKKYAGLTKMKCVQTGQMEKCCAEQPSGNARVYHAVI
jgi:copper chaperone CopZ